MIRVVSDTFLSYPCQHVVSEGALCGMPCDPGFVRCSEHRNYNDKRALLHELNQAQDRVIRKISAKIDDAVAALIDIALNGRSETARIRAIEVMLRLQGFADLKIDIQGGSPIEPGDRDRVLMGLIRDYIKNPQKLAELERKGGAIDVDIRDPDDRGPEPS